jgi:DNA-binding CsgD family transcriptional regulator/tetratricopeptide (TPR) repeat protein
LDGIPLAIELAAARAKVLSVEQIAERLDDRFRLLTGGSRTAPPRHQTLKAAMDWSYDLLSDGEKALLRRLSVFAGGWTLAAAEAVCADMLPPAPPFYALPTSSLLPLPPAGGGRGGGGGLGWGGKVGNDKALPLGGAEKAGVVDPIIHPGDILDLLTQLVNKSLVVMMEERGAEARYRLLETVRQYALEKLQESGEEAPLRSRHLGWFLGLAERAEQELRGRDQAKWIEHLESEHDNLRAALEWSKLALSRSNVTLSQSPEPFGPERASEPALSRSSERSEEETKGQAPRRGSEGTSEEPERSEGEGKEGASESTLRLAGALGWFWYVRGYFSEGRGWLEGMLSGSKGISAPVLAKAVNGAGLLAWGQGDHLRAAELCEESLAMYRGLGEVDGMAHSLFILGIVGEYQGDHERARALLEESLSLFREVGDKWGAAHSLRILGGMIWASQGDHERAEAQLEESLSLFREVGDKGGIAYSLISLSIKAFGQGDHKRAATMLEESISLFQEIGDKSGVSISLLFMGVARLHQRDFGQAGVLFEESLALRGEMGDKAGIAGCLEGLAAVAGLQGRLQRAARLVGAAKALREATGIPLRPHFRADYDRIVSAVRLRLGEEGFEAASEEGRKMTLEQAIQYGRSAEEHSSQATYSAAATAPQPTIPATLYPAGLTAREVEVLRLVAMGLTNAQVAEKLDVSARTIDSHLWLVYRKIGVSSRTAAARYAIDHKLA